MAKAKAQEQAAASPPEPVPAATDSVVESTAPALDPRDALIAELREQNALLRAQRADAKAAGVNQQPPTYGLKESPPVDQDAATGPAQAARADPRHAIGQKAPGKRLWSVHIPGHKSRVVDRDRGIAVMVTHLPVWAANKGEAWEVFCDYHKGLSTIHTPEIYPISEVVPAEE